MWEKYCLEIPVTLEYSKSLSNVGSEQVWPNCCWLEDAK